MVNLIGFSLSSKQKLCLLIVDIFSSAEIPDAKPFIDGIMTRYRPGDELKGNCTSQFSKPAANLSWTVNDVPVCIILVFSINRYSIHQFSINDD